MKKAEDNVYRYKADTVALKCVLLDPQNVYVFIFNEPVSKIRVVSHKNSRFLPAYFKKYLKDKITSGIK